jgi:hypothetical protein
MGTPPRDRSDDTAPVESVRDRLTSDYDTVEATIHEDDTEMTPMLTLSVDGGRTRAEVLREAYALERETDIRISAVHRHRIVVRAE